MEVISITLPRKLGLKLKERAEEVDSFPEEIALEIISRDLGEKLDPEELVEHYQTLSEKYLAEAKEFLSKGDLVQASEKLWGASATAVKSVAAKRGVKLERHGSLWDFVDKVSKEREDEEIIRFFTVANGLHRNLYEDQMTKRPVEIAAKDIEKLINKLRDSLH